MKHFLIRKAVGYSATALAFALLVACGDDDSFSPVAKDRGYDYAYTSAKDLSKTPCNEMREGREAIIGRDKDRYECKYDYRDSVYIWVSYDDTLTAEGREYHRAESSSSSDEEGDSSSSSSSVTPQSSSSAASVSSSYSSSSSSSSNYSSSSSYSYIARTYDGYAKGPYSLELNSKEELFNPDVDYGTLTDTRDGQVYRTVVIGNRVWMAENLNFAGNDDYPNVKRASVCYNYNAANCSLLGRLYSRDAAFNDGSCRYDSYCDLGDTLIRGVCPEGWHIPSIDDVENFRDAFDGDAAAPRSVKGWNDTVKTATDVLGFSMPGSGNLNLYDRSFGHAGETGYLWLYTPSRDFIYMIFVPALVDTTARVHSGYMYEVLIPVRCVSDDTLKVSRTHSSSSVSSSSSSIQRYSSSLQFDLDTSYYSVETKEVFFNPDIDYGEMTDPRDGKKYKTVEVDGKIWMAENLNYADSSEYPLLKGEILCYNNDNDNCELFGRLYSRLAAMNDERCEYLESCLLGNGFLQGICPDGWHIPGVVESRNLMAFVNQESDKLRSIRGWRDRKDEYGEDPGEDTYGLSFAPGGSYTSAGYFGSMGLTSFTWAYYESKEQYYILINGEQIKSQVTNFNAYKLFMSVRCIKD